jgi:hypothetical protein
MWPLPTLGGGEGFPRHMNELGQIAGFSVTTEGALHAALWTPVRGPLAVRGAKKGSADMKAGRPGEAR